MAWQTVGASIKGNDGEPGTPGVDVDDATINASGHLIITLSDGSTIDAGTAKGDPGGGIDFESSVQSVADLPTTAPYGEARFVRDDGHLYVYEPAADRPETVDGWTDVGPIRGEQGDPGSDGVSVTGATVNASGELVLTLSVGEPINAGNVVGPKGDTGDAGTPGDPGEKGDPGDPGVSVTDAEVDASGNLIVTLSEGDPITAGHVVGEQGPPGDEGTDGATGDTGPRGATWFVGEGAPPGEGDTPIPGSLPGDFYLDTDDGQIYELS